MKKIRLVAAASIATAVTLLSAGAAQAYPDAPNVTITIHDNILYGGDKFSYTANADVDCDWTISYPRAAGQSPTQTGSGTSTSGSYDTPPVKEVERSNITATCEYDDGAPASAGVQASALQTASASAVVTLLPRGGAGDADEDAALPDTGGSNLWLFAVGGALVLVGGGTLYAARRRHSAR